MAEGGGLLNRYTAKSCIGGSNPPLSAIFPAWRSGPSHGAIPRFARAPANQGQAPGPHDGFPRSALFCPLGALAQGLPLLLLAIARFTLPGLLRRWEEDPGGSYRSFNVNVPENVIPGLFWNS